MVGGGDPFYLKFWVNRPRWSEIADFQPIIASSSSAVTRSEKSLINANRQSTKRFPMSQRGPQKAKRPISIKNALRVKKVCYKVSLCENCQRQSCKAFIGLTNCAKIIGGGSDPLHQTFRINMTELVQNRRFSKLQTSNWCADWIQFVHERCKSREQNGREMTHGTNCKFWKTFNLSGIAEATNFKFD